MREKLSSDTFIFVENPSDWLSVIQAARFLLLTGFFCGGYLSQFSSSLKYFCCLSNLDILINRHSRKGVGIPDLVKMLLEFKLHGVKRASGAPTNVSQSLVFSIGMHTKTLPTKNFAVHSWKINSWHLLGSRGRICSCAAMRGHEISAGLIYTEKEIPTQLVSLAKWKCSALNDEEGKGHD